MTAATLYQRGIDLANAGRHAAARRQLDAALARDPDPDVEALVTGILAYIVSETGDADTALAMCLAAAADPRLSAHTRAVLAGQTGLIELRRGDADAALKHLSAAAARLDTDPARQGRALLNRGLVRLDRTEPAAALRDFGRAAEAFDRSGEPVEQAKALHNQGYAAMLTGDLVTAIRSMDAARPVLAALSPVAAAVGDADRAEVLLAAGMTTEAVRVLREVARVYGLRRLRQAQAEAELALARALSAESPLEASTIARRAARRFRSRGSESWAVRADALALGAAIAGGRGGPAVRAAAEQTATALAAARRVDDAAALRLQVVRAEVRGGDPFRRVRVRESAPIVTRLLADEVLAEIAEAEGSASGALRRAAAGLDRLRDWQSAFGSLELQSAAAAHGRTLAVLGVRVAVGTGDPGTVLEWSERVRALSKRVAVVRAPSDPDAAGQLAELRALRAAASGADAAAGRELDTRETELRESIRRRRWTRDGGGTREPRVALADLAAALAEDGAVFVSYLWTVDRLTALVVGPSGTRLVDLGEWAPVDALLAGLLADLDMAATALPSALRQAVRTGLADRMARLDALLVAPLMLPAGDRVVITPAGALAGVPWGMLPSLAGRAVAVPGSAAEWLAGRGTVADLSATGFVAGPGVARAEAEVLAAASSWPEPAILSGGAATADAVSRLAPRVDLLHVAAHGRHSADNPLFSAFELADGAWYGYDIDQLERVPRVVVLSACELGRSATRWGIEALGMSRAWLHAGAHCVISSPSAIADTAAEHLLRALHTRVAAGDGPAEALAAAGRETGIVAPFVCHGSGW
nr:CHAT domain-containing protein [Conyzicola lurida]